MIETANEDLVPTTIETQIRDAYREMSKHARYRPAAPGDGFGNIVPEEQLNLEKESETYAARWWKEEEGYEFWIGCCEW